MFILQTVTAGKFVIELKVNILIDHSYYLLITDENQYSITRNYIKTSPSLDLYINSNGIVEKSIEVVLHLVDEVRQRPKKN